MKTRIRVAAFIASLFLHTPVFSLTAQEAMDLSGVTAGVVVHLNASDGAMESEFGRTGCFLVHGIAHGAVDRLAGQSRLLKDGLNGLAVIEVIDDLTRLPYSTDFVDLLVVDRDALGTSGPSDEEIRRVLVPGDGAALIHTGASWSKVTKSMPLTWGEWTHHHGGPDQTLVGKGGPAGVPNSLQWIGNYWLSKNMSSISTSNLRVSGGKAAYIMPARDNSCRTCWHRSTIIARSAFNGVPLFHMLRTGVSDYRPGEGGMGREGFVTNGRMLYTWLFKDQPMKEIDMHTGRITSSYDAGIVFKGESIHGSAFSKGTIFQTGPNEVAALESITGRLLWKNLVGGRYVTMATVAEDKGLLFVVAGDTPPSSRWRRASGTVYAFDVTSGTKKWSKGMGELSQLAYRAGKLFYYASKCIGGFETGKVGALDPSTGSTMWGQSAEGLSLVVWNGKLAFGSATFTFLDENGKKIHELKAGYNGRCFKVGGFENRLLMNMFTWYDPQFNAATTPISRGGCSQSGTFAYDMHYMQPTGCGCMGLGRQGGFQAHAYRASWPEYPDSKRLQTGAAYGRSPTSGQAFTGTGPIVKDWELTNFRVRGTDLVDSAGTPMGPDFSYAFWTPRVTPSRTADGTTYQSVIHEHRVEARKGGALAWSFVTGGRVWAPPVVSGGTVYFGAADGYAYAVDAESGQLKWRYLVARGLKKMVAWSQLESAWPVFGVLLKDGVVYASAGRHDILDDGIRVAALNAVTGIPLWKARLYTTDGKAIIYGGIHKNFHTARNDVPEIDSTGMLHLVGDKAYFDLRTPMDVVNGIAAPTSAGRHPVSTLTTNFAMQLHAPRGYIDVRTGFSGHHGIELHDALGRLLLSKSFTVPTHVRIPLAGLSANAMLLATMRTATQSRTVRLAVRR